MELPAGIGEGELVLFYRPAAIVIGGVSVIVSLVAMCIIGLCNTSDVAFLRQMTDILSVRDLMKGYGAVRAVDGVSFAVQQGEIFGLLGTNGAGKTTTLECLIGLRAADAGSVEICGFKPASHPNEVKQRIGVALQSTSLCRTA